MPVDDEPADDARERGGGESDDRGNIGFDDDDWCRIKRCWLTVPNIALLLMMEVLIGEFDGRRVVGTLWWFTNLVLLDDDPDPSIDELGDDDGIGEITVVLWWCAAEVGDKGEIVSCWWLPSLPSLILRFFVSHSNVWWLIDGSVVCDAPTTMFFEVIRWSFLLYFLLLTLRLSLSLLWFFVVGSKSPWSPPTSFSFVISTRLVHSFGGDSTSTVVDVDVVDGAKDADNELVLSLSVLCLLLLGDVAVLADSFLLPDAATSERFALVAGKRLSTGSAPSFSSLRLGSEWCD